MAATLGLAALFGALLARRAQNRINAISNTLLSVSQGRLDARVPMSGSSDDIDHVGEQINRTLGHLEMLVDKVNQASSDIAHDLKKPIGRLQQNLDQARRTAKTPSEFQSAIETALRDLDSIVDTFEALLNITQIEAGARKARFREVDLSRIISDMKEVYEAVAEDSGDALLTDSEIEGPALVRGDKELLTQLLANLIENAICHCPRQTRINVGLALTDSGYSIRVADNGPGIPASERCNVLRRLYRLERARSTPGNGLGLSLVLAIAEFHDATLALEDNAPGLKVMITFPKLAA
jgi:signal transduction histidine kinase